MLRLTTSVWGQLVAHAYDDVPLESCGLLVGRGDTAGRYVRIPNAAASARVYELDGRAHLRAEREADDDGLEVIGVVHSHTHTDPYPSPTDVAAAPDPAWHYVIVSLADEAPRVRSYRIVGATIAEEPIELVD